jgi:hypothetical protein
MTTIAPDFEQALVDLQDHLPSWWESRNPEAVLYGLLTAVGAQLDNLAWLFEQPYLNSVLDTANEEGLLRNFAFAYGLELEQLPPTAERLRPYIQACSEMDGSLTGLLRILMAIIGANATINTTGGAVLTFPDPTEFPALPVIDSFTRAPENPLSDGGRWATITGATGTGEIIESQSWKAPLEAEGGAYWDPAEQAEPAVSIEKVGNSGLVGAYFGVWACLTAAARSGYLVRATTTNVAAKECTVTIEKWVAGVKTVLATTEKVVFNVGSGSADALGLSVSGGVVRSWHRVAGVWTQLAEAADATYSTGYTGFMGAKGSILLRNFAYGNGGGLVFPENGEGLQLFQFAAAEGPKAGLTFPSNGEGLRFPTLPSLLPSDNMIGNTGETPPGAGPGLTFSQNEYILITQNSPGPYQFTVEILNWLSFDRNAFRRALERYNPSDCYPPIVQEVSVLA